MDGVAAKSSFMQLPRPAMHATLACIHPATGVVVVHRVISMATRELVGAYRANKNTMAIVNSPVAAINTLWPQRAICPSIISIS